MSRKAGRASSLRILLGQAFENRRRERERERESLREIGMGTRVSHQIPMMIYVGEHRGSWERDSESEIILNHLDLSAREGQDTIVTNHRAARESLREYKNREITRSIDIESKI